MKSTRVQTLPLRTEDDIVYVCNAVRYSMLALTFRSLEQTKMVTAASELSRNVLIHGGGGMAVIEECDSSVVKILRVTFIDKGPGIADIEMALSDGFTTGCGLGLGLGGAKRLVHQFQIYSSLGEGTTVIITMKLA